MKLPNYLFTSLSMLCAVAFSLSAFSGSADDKRPAADQKQNYAPQEARWWKGNTHTHTWWSDGDAPPEVIADWYKNHDYQFLVFSDHNIMQEGEKWYSIDKPARRPEQIKMAYDTYLAMFGKDWVEERSLDGERQVKLKTLDEFRALFEEQGKFIFIKGEEITDRFAAHPVHVNGVNTVDLIEPQGGESIVATIQNNIDAVRAQSDKYKQPMLAHLNHPNFRYAHTADDFFNLEYSAEDGFFEMYNGHSHVSNYGDQHHDSAERMWDIVLAKRLGELNRSAIYGVAVDDAHEYTVWGTEKVNPGRGWIMVRSHFLTPNKITEAIKRGDFYNSTGVTLKSLTVEDGKIDLEIDAEKGVKYTIEFVGTLNNVDLSAKAKKVDHPHGDIEDHLHKTVKTYSNDIGKVLTRTKGTKATYTAKGNEIYVRARIISDKKHPNPHEKGDVEMAWTQPLVVKK